MKKILIINLLLIVIINSFSICFASETEKIKYMGECPLYLMYKGNFKSVHYAAYEKNSQEFPAYCLNPEFGGVGSNGREEYDVKINKRITNEKIWRVIINGYPYKSLKELGVETKEEAYTATQFAIYTVLDNRNIKDYTTDESLAGKRTLNAYLKIMEAAKKTGENMINNIEILPDFDNWRIDENEIEYLSKTYLIKSNITNGFYNLKVTGDNVEKLKITDEKGIEKTAFSLNEKFKILAPIETLSDDFKIELQVEVEANTYPIFYGESTIPETQNYALTGEKNEKVQKSYQDIIPKNNSKIKVIKQESENKKRLEGVKFNLLNVNKDFVIQNLVTNTNGEIIIENIVPGTYYLQEIETLEGYKLIEEPIEINIKFNDEKEIIVENSLKTEEHIYEEPIPDNVIIENVVIEKKLPVTGY